MNAVILSGNAVALHAAGVIRSLTAIPQALIGIVLCRAAVRFERTEISFRTTGAP
jgi:hypothetical protein